MKTIKVLSFALSIILLAFVSCQKNEDIDNTLSLELTKEINPSRTLTALLDEIITENGSSNDFIYYDFVLDDNNNISLNNPRIVKRTRITETFNAYRKSKKSTTINLLQQQRTGGVQVCCTLDGENFTCDTCSGNPAEQTECIITIINDCLDNGGCSSVCDKTMIYNPENQEFIIVSEM